MWLCMIGSKLMRVTLITLARVVYKSLLVHPLSKVLWWTRHPKYHANLKQFFLGYFSKGTPSTKETDLSLNLRNSGHHLCSQNLKRYKTRKLNCSNLAFTGILIQIRPWLMQLSSLVTSRLVLNRWLTIKHFFKLQITLWESNQSNRQLLK